jgi:membrane-bound ClpP family serine protease
MRPLLLAGLVLLIIGLALVIVGFVVTGFEVAKWIGIAVAIVGLGIAVVDWASARRIR